MAVYINQELVNSVAPGAADSYVRDSEVKGFTLKVTPAGSRVYTFQYRAPDGRQRKITLGAEPTLNAMAARAQAIRCAERLRAGEDPAPEQREIKRTPTMADAWAEFCAAHEGTLENPGKWREKTAKEYRRIFDGYVDGKLKARRVNEVAFVELDKNVQRVAKDHGPGMAHNLRKRLETFFGWCCIGDRYLPAHKNPARGIKTDAPKREHFVFEKPDLFRLGQVLKEAEQKEWPAAIFAVRFILYTGVRKQEALDLRWDEVDLEKGSIKLSPERHKTGRKSGLKEVYLSDEAIAVLKAAKEFSDALSRGTPLPYVFPSPKDRMKPIVGFQKIWERIRAKAGVSARIHDLRHNFGGVGAETVSQVHVRDLLGHKNIGTTNGYMKTRREANREAANAVASAIAADLEPSNVVSLGKKR